MAAAASSFAAPVFLPSSGLGKTAEDDWELGPFVKHKEPVLRPRRDSVFTCPIRGKEVRWEEQNTYNPAAVVRGGKVYILYRADDRSPDLGWGRTCRIGLAHSEDGIHFTRHERPVLYPDNDKWKKYEWEGGCEDLHIIEGEDGTYYMNYTTWSGKRDTMSVATSRDLVHWTKHGPAFRKNAPEKVYGSRSGVVVSRLEGDRLIATKINGKHWMYYTHPCALAWSENLIDRDDLTTVLKEQKEPFLHPEHDWEQRGFTGHTTVSNGLVHFKGRWLLYYGAADRVIGLAICTSTARGRRQARD